MTRQTESLIKSTLPVLHPDDVACVAQLLRDPEAEFSTLAPSREPADELLALLRVRQANSVRVGRRIVGIGSVIERLADMPARTAVLGYGVISPHAAANIYFLEKSHRAVGATLVER